MWDEVIWRLEGVAPRFEPSTGLQTGARVRGLETAGQLVLLVSRLGTTGRIGVA